MTTIYSLKPAFQNLLRPITQSLARNGVTANQVTLAAALLSFATGALILVKADEPAYLFAVPAVLFVRMALNAIDGMLAREHGMKSQLGAILNELGDILSDSALYLPYAMVPGVNALPVVLVVLLAVVSETAGILGVTIGASRRYDGPMGKSDRAFVFGVIALLLGFGVPAGPWLTIVWNFMIALLAITIFNRARRALSEKR